MHNLIERLDAGREDVLPPKIEDDQLVRVVFRNEHGQRCTAFKTAQELGALVLTQSGGEDARDAARYRHLRDHMPKEWVHEKGLIRWYLPRSGRGFLSLDEALDRAIAAQAESGGG